jgi:hypothetical protein
MSEPSEARPTKVKGNPTKDFFVSMLTRDIDLEDAILDLLDNCVDGIQRNTRGQLNPEKPFEGYTAHIQFNKESFSIEDNCGGISLDIAVDYAFRMGRPSDFVEESGLATIGTYGIGMKRAMFKIGHDWTVESYTESECFSVTIPALWLSSGDDWSFDLNQIQRENKPNGTKIIIQDLHAAIAEKFGNSTFESNLIARISQTYSFIIYKGFSVKVNNNKIIPKPIDMIFNVEENVLPYVYTDEIDGVEIFLIIGLYRSIPSDKELQEEQNGTRYSSEKAGWTIICNDRIVLYCDKSKLTGWGESKVPSYHTQFIAISGMVQFTSDDSRKLPITTTKRGIDASSEIYLTIKEFMREGLKHFTDYTNRWKSQKEEERVLIEQAKSIPLTQIATKIKEIPEIEQAITLRGVKGKPSAKRFKPSLPNPRSISQQSDLVTISFRKPSESIKQVSAYLFDGDSEENPSNVGKECFEYIVRKLDI